MWFWQGHKNTRNTILRGIYLDNLKTFGSAPMPSILVTHSTMVKVMLISALTAPTLLLGNSGIRNADETNQVLKHLAADVASEETAIQAREATVETTPPLIFKATEASPVVTGLFQTDFEDLQGEGMPALRKLFGLSVQTIVIDPGHGGVDPGTSGKSGLQEKKITLDIALNLKKRLEQYGRYQVMLTRDEDETISLKNRIDYANKVKADLFISIHVNYLPTLPNNLIETYYYGVSADNNTIDLAESENSDSDVAMHEFSLMVEKLGNTLKLQESKRLASDIQQSLYTQIATKKTRVLDMGIRKAPFLVIMGTDMPAVLAEVTSISNAEEEAKLQTAEYRDDIAKYLETGITNYLNRGDYIYEAKR